MKLIVGLGNVGKEYKNTRHNLGFLAVDRMQKNSGAPAFAERKRFSAFLTEIGGRPKTLLAKPTTMMNLSGRAVAALLSYYKITPENLWVLHDDLDLPVGTIRHSFDSRAAGHNGVQSVIDCLDTKQFHRIRIGIGRPVRGNAEAYVLKKIPSAERKEIEKAVEKFRSIFTSRKSSSLRV